MWPQDAHFPSLSFRFLLQLPSGCQAGKAWPLQGRYPERGYVISHYIHSLGFPTCPVGMAALSSPSTITLWGDDSLKDSPIRCRCMWERAGLGVLGEPLLEKKCRATHLPGAWPVFYRPQGAAQTSVKSRKAPSRLSSLLPRGPQVGKESAPASCLPWQEGQFLAHAALRSPGKVQAAAL